MIKLLNKPEGVKVYNNPLLALDRTIACLPFPQPDWIIEHWYPSDGYCADQQIRSRSEAGVWRSFSYVDSPQSEQAVGEFPIDK